MITDSIDFVMASLRLIQYVLFLHVSVDGRESPNASKAAPYEGEIMQKNIWFDRQIGRFQNLKAFFFLWLLASNI